MNFRRPNYSATDTTIKGLKDVLTEMELSTSGNKATLVARIADAYVSDGCDNLWNDRLSESAYACFYAEYYRLESEGKLVGFVIL